MLQEKLDGYKADDPTMGEVKDRTKEIIEMIDIRYSFICRPLVALSAQAGLVLLHLLHKHCQEPPAVLLLSELELRVPSLRAVTHSLEM